MANTADSITCDGFVFYNNFDSANLARVERVKAAEICEKDSYEVEGKSCKSSSSDVSVDYEFNLWTKHDCHGTPYQNNNRTWFYFGIKAVNPGICVKLNILNLNKQVKMFSQGMCPVFKIVPGHLHWERIREKPTYNLDQKGTDFALSFHYYAPENPKAITYFAFTYPFSYTDLQNQLRKIDAKMSKRSITTSDDIYYHRECAIKSLEGRRLEVLTISSFHNISTEREDRLKNMFPEMNEDRPYKFWDKKVIFVSARVHPGETPSSFVLNGFLHFLLNREDQIAINLRRQYVFKLIPMLNPDGVARGHYRMDTRGVNLNRVYLNPSEKEHPTIFAARNLIRYYHYSYKLPEETAPGLMSNIDLEIGKDSMSIVSANGSFTKVIRDTTAKLLQQVTLMTLDEKGKGEPEIEQQCTLIEDALDNIPNGGGEGLSDESQELSNSVDESSVVIKFDDKTCSAVGVGEIVDESGLYLYIDLHGHASKKGVFMYGNHFDNPEDTITCMLLPKLMSINNPNFHFTSCNFAERNMYLIDKRDGMSREGSGRVAVYKMTGLVRSYTLECNYNSGRLVNSIPARVRDGVNKTMSHMFVPPKYTPVVFEAVGAALGPSILDLSNSNPNSRLPNSQYRSLRGVKSYLKLTYVNNLSGSLNKPLHKDDYGIISQGPLSFKGLESKDNCDHQIGVKESLSSEMNVSKKATVLRRSASLYMTMKRIKSTKKNRQHTIRRSLKNQSIENIENNSLVCPSAILQSNTQSNKKNLIRSGDDIPHQTKTCKSVKKLKPVGVTEETSVVKQGAKRLKVDHAKLSKTRPEIGESSNTTDKSVKPLTRALFMCDQRSGKNVLGRARKHCTIVEHTKYNKSSKLRETTKDR